MTRAALITFFCGKTCIPYFGAKILIIQEQTGLFIAKVKKLSCVNYKPKVASQPIG